MYSSIVQQTTSGVEFYIRAFPELAGLSYGAARRAFPVRPLPQPLAKSGHVFVILLMHALQHASDDSARLLLGSSCM